MRADSTMCLLSDIVGSADRKCKQSPWYGWLLFAFSIISERRLLDLEFEYELVFVSVRVGTSKNGKPYAFVRLANGSTYENFDVFCSVDVANSIRFGTGTPVLCGFKVNGGQRLSVGLESIREVG